MEHSDVSSTEKYLLLSADFHAAISWCPSVEFLVVKVQHYHRAVSCTSSLLILQRSFQINGRLLLNISLGKDQPWCSTHTAEGSQGLFHSRVLQLLSSLWIFWGMHCGTQGFFLRGFAPAGLCGLPEPSSSQGHQSFQGELWAKALPCKTQNFQRKLRNMASPVFLPCFSLSES